MPKLLKFCSWNVNGIRAVAKKGFFDWLNNSDFDIVCLQEIKAQDEQLGHDFNSLFYPQVVFNGAQRKGYSGVANYIKSSLASSVTTKGFLLERFAKLELPRQILEIDQGKKETKIVQTGTFTREELKAIIEEFNAEGRVTETQMPFRDSKLILLNIYFPNGGASTDRLRFKLNFYEVFLVYVQALLQETPYIVVTGDYNTAHHACDLARPDENTNTSGFMQIERDYLDRFENLGFRDTYRLIHPQAKDAYTWWSFRTAARSRNVGWRIDYFFVSAALKGYLVDADIHSKVDGSDHCPISLTLSCD